MPGTVRGGLQDIPNAINQFSPSGKRRRGLLTTPKFLRIEMGWVRARTMLIGFANPFNPLFTWELRSVYTQLYARLRPMPSSHTVFRGTGKLSARGLEISCSSTNQFQLEMAPPRNVIK